MTLADLLSPHVLLPWLLGMMFGVFVGATPGLTATMAVALIVPFTYHLDPAAGLAMIVGVSFTAIFAGDIPATYLRIPGTPASAAATLDGHELARRGRGRFALFIDLFCSCLGGLVGVGLLIATAPLLAQVALLFSSYEKFWLAIVGLSLSALVTKGDTRKGMLSAMLGIFISLPGQDPLTSAPRYAFGVTDLLPGLEFIPVMIGLFGFSEVLRSLSLRGKDLATATGADDPADALPAEKGRFFADLKEAAGQTWKRKWLALQSALLGSGVGALPGAGADIAAWASYGLGKKTASDRESFGEGTVGGVVAPTAANNAAVAGAWIPALVFGVPGDAVTAIVLGAFRMHDIHTGPALFTQSAQMAYTIFAIALITQLLLFPAGLFGIQVFGWMMRLPKSVVMTAVVIFSVVGAFAVNNSLIDVYVMFAFGLIGFLLESRNVPLAPMILGLILGEMVEENLRRGLISASGSFTPFFTRPLCAAMLTILLAAFLAPPVWRLVSSARRIESRD